MINDKSIWLKVFDNRYYSGKKCSRCGTITTKDSRIVYHGKYNRQNKCKIVCENCLTESDYFSLNFFHSSGREIFEFLQYAWDVEKMNEYAIATGMKTKTISVESIKAWNLSGFIRIKNDRLEKVDITKPCIMVNLSQIKNEYVIVDGNHRCRKAINSGLENLEFYCFEFKEQFKFMLNTEFETLEEMVAHSLKV